MATTSSTTKYPQTLSAVKALEHDHWSIADAVLAEAGTNDSELGQCSAWLLSQGYDYDRSTLAKYARTAEAFPAPRRRGSVSFSSHMEAGEPDILDQAWEQNGKRPPTVQMVREIRQAVRRAIREQREQRAAEQRKQAAERAEAQRQEAQRLDAEAERAREAAEKAQATDDKDSQRDAAEKARQAEREREKALKALATAERVARTASGVVIGSRTAQRAMPDPADVARARVVAKAIRLRDQAVQLASGFAEVAEELDNDAIQEHVRMVVAAWEGVLAQPRFATTDRPTNGHRRETARETTSVS